LAKAMASSSVSKGEIHSTGPKISSFQMVISGETSEMVRSLVGAGVGCSLLHMRPKTQVTYAGHKIVEVPFDDAADSFKIVLGYFPKNPRRLVKYFVENLKELFLTEDVNRFLVNKE
jgi:DNA-binding transcriptional LysR family regulator